MMRRPVARAVALALVACLSLVACRGVYYDAMERLGKQKRHILRDRVESAQDSQREAEEQFQTAYERFVEVTGYSGGDLEAIHGRLAAELESSEEKAQEVRDRIDAIEVVAGDLFAEWEAELAEIQNARLRSSSEANLRSTRTRYGTLIAAMKRAESKMDPVLAAFRDQVLYLKHNLNAKAIASLEGSVGAIEDDVEALIRDIRASIEEAESFLASEEGAA